MYTITVVYRNRVDSWTTEEPNVEIKTLLLIAREIVKLVVTRNQ
jgi:hypothetical protein